jgi:hypothetical protein
MSTRPLLLRSLPLVGRVAALGRQALAKLGWGGVCPNLEVAV